MVTIRLHRFYCLSWPLHEKRLVFPYGYAQRYIHAPTGTAAAADAAAVAAAAVVSKFKLLLTSFFFVYYYRNRDMFYPGVCMALGWMATTARLAPWHSAQSCPTVSVSLADTTNPETLCPCSRAWILTACCLAATGIATTAAMCGVISEQRGFRFILTCAAAAVVLIGYKEIK